MCPLLSGGRDARGCGRLCNVVAERVEGEGGFGGTVKGRWVWRELESVEGIVVGYWEVVSG